ncbi:beta-glucosidase [bacterium]|nr:beta-glucosidase [bacterium]
MPNIDTLLDRMSLEEQVALLSGADFWSVAGNERLGLGTLRVTDGPNGARGGGSLVGGVKSAAFPVGIALGATWDPALTQEIGRALAEEVKSKGAHVSLAPTCNIQRSVTNGRNFECYSEDPILTADLAVGYIRGLQGMGISATIKHFAGNESEIERTTMSSDIDERTLREVYLVPFEAAVKRAGTWGIMSSYNKVNGTYAAENHWFLTQVLRKDWGYDGVVMSDWFGSRSTEPTVNAGLDLEMPGPTRDRGDKLIAAVRAGLVSEATVRERAGNVLRLMARTGALEDHRPHEEHAIDRPEHRALIRRAGAAGTVLLKNDGVLPLSRLGTVAVIGPNAKAAQIMGGGSAQLNPHYSVSPFDGLAAALGAEALRHAPGCTNHRFEPVLQGTFTVEFFAGKALQGPVLHSETLNDLNAFWIPPLGGGKVDPFNFSARVTGSFVPDVSGPHRVGAFAAGYAKVFVDGHLIANAWDGWKKGRTFFEEGCDEVVGEVDLTAGRACKVVVEFCNKPSDNLVFAGLRVGIGRPLGDADLAAAVEVARTSDRAVVFVGRTAEWDTEGSDLESIRLPGRQDELVRAVLEANPRTVVVLQTGGPVEMPWIDMAPAVLQAWYPGQEAGNAIADVLFGDEPGGRLAQTFPRIWADNPTHSQDPEIYPGLNGHVRYEEGVFIGYRHYDRMGTAPLFPFGHGLSYTSFALTDIRASATGVTATLTNTGARDGSTVVQVYVGDVEASVPRPKKELKGFAKVHLAVGQSQTVTIALEDRAFAFFDVTAGQWRIETGAFEISTGFSATDLRDVTVIERAGALLAV